MDQRQLEPLHEMRKWLNQHMNRTIHIEKIEADDLDRVQIHLTRVNVGQQQIHDPDDYVPDQALILHGSGAVENELPNISDLQDINHLQDAETIHGTQNMENMQDSKSINRQSHLPQEAYEIPITENMMVEQLGNQLLITTERAVYRLEGIK